MLDAHVFLKALATVLGVAAVTTVLFHRLRLPVVLGYILAGMIVGPYLPVPIAADRAVVTTLSELGVILLMFSIGLEFSLRKIVRVGPTAGLVMIIEVSVMLWLGYLIGRLLGWSALESVFTGAIISISSTMIIAKTFAEKRPDRQHAELVFGILVFEDLMAILILAVVTALSVGSLSAATLVSTVGRLAAFLVGLVVFGILLVPRLVRYIARLGSPETLLIAAIGLCFGIALLAQAVGYSVALGAFIAGSLVAESGEGKKIEHLVQPVRDLFGAVFFVSVGMSIDPRLVLAYWREGLLLTAVVIGGKIVGVSMGAFLTGHSIRASIQTAMTLAQIGEFSFIIAGVGVSQHATREFLYPVAVAVSAVTAMTTPLLVRYGGTLASHIDRRLPRALQTFAALYGSWIERLRTQPFGQRSELIRLIKVVLIDEVALAGIAIGASLSVNRLLPLVQQVGRLTPLLSKVAVAVAALALSVPFWVGLFRSIRRLAAALASRAIPLVAAGEADLSAAPRRALRVTLELLVLLLVGAPLLAVTQPFLPSLSGAMGAPLWVALLVLIGIAFWRSANNLIGHVQAGAQAVIEALATQSASPVGESTESESGSGGSGSLAPLGKLLSGLGPCSAEHIEPRSPSVGKTLAQLNLRGLTGATVLAIQRGAGGLAAPGAKDQVLADDVLVLGGSAEAIQAARRLLHDLPAEHTDDGYELFSVTH